MTINLGVNKSALNLLEKLFSNEVASAMGGCSGLAQLEDSKARFFLLENNYIQEASVTLTGRFPVTCHGYVLTERGRLEYCESCDT